MSASALIEGEIQDLTGLGASLFDVHAHTGADIDGTERSCEEHVEVLAPLGGRSVIFPFCVNSGYEAENRRVVEECRRNPDRLVPFARLDPRVSGAADAAAAIGFGARGFKLHPRAEDFRLDHPNVDAIFNVAAEARAPVLIHAGVGIGSFGETVTELARRHRDCPMILAHAGISDLAWLHRELPEHPNVFFDTAWLVPADLLALFALVPPSRILYGSDAPYMDGRLLLAVTLRCARFAGLSEEAIALVVGGQLEGLLGGEAAVDAGPPPGLPPSTPDPDRMRLASLLSAAGGCVLGDGDPSQALELARLAVDGGATDEESRAVADLVGEAAFGCGDAISALVLALAFTLTPGAGRATAIA